MASKGWRLQTAEGCAWRALYLYRPHMGLGGDTLCARIVLDPNNGVTPTLSGAIVLPQRSKVEGYFPHREHGFRWRLPRVSWATAYRFGGPVMSLYKAQSWFWHKVDGRYGWGARHG